MAKLRTSTPAPRAETHVLAVILARAGSKGLPSKNILPIAGRPMIAHTIEQAKAANRVNAVCVTTDLSMAADVARKLGVYVVDRPPELAGDAATVDSAVRHAVETYEQFRKPVTHVVILYGNVPVRAPGIIDLAVEHLMKTGCDSVRSISPVDKQHPDWLHRLEGDKLVQFRKNSIYRRQDLEPLFYHDGAVLAVTRSSLFLTSRDDNHAFLGKDRRAVVSSGGPTVDVDSPADMAVAEGILAARATSLGMQVEQGLDTVTLTDASRGGGVESKSVNASSQCPAIQIANRTIGDLQSTFIIAEAGVNHDGSVDKAKALIEAAKAAGADAVKFQYFISDHLVAENTPTCDYQIQNDSGARNQRELLRRLELNEGEFRELAKCARDVGIFFLATPFGIDELHFLTNDLRVPAIKIASPDIINIPLLTAACEADLPIILSTGASHESEISRAVDLIRRCGAAGRLALLHCVSSYPTPRGDARLRSIAALHEHFGVPTGFSDHTAEIETGAAAVFAGAAILEKHITLDRTAKGPDHFFSLEPSQFRDFVTAVRAAEVSMGNRCLEPSPAELQVRELARGRILARRAISADEIIRNDMLTVRRAPVGISAALWNTVIGSRAATFISADSPITPSMLQTDRTDSAAVS